ncbi:hypothetical protein [Deinococcus alpinitundrae]|uniref:hypothetical protein n=1 Tax=Deinococcus alpinitundrae TaxID=468913 RepID=UPI00137B79BC|nr:hypothetical protein [Deinococcus alpinitundrae]
MNRFLLAPARRSLGALTLAALGLLPLAAAERVRVPGTDLSIDLPVGFIAMPPDVVASKYARTTTPPTQVYSTPGPHWEVNIAFAMRDVRLPDGDLNPTRTALEGPLKNVPGFRWVKHDVETVAGREWIVLQFWVNGLDTPIYNDLRVTRQGDKTLLVTANVTKALYGPYAARLGAAMQSLK